jgi:hypothetical protein
VNLVQIGGARGRGVVSDHANDAPKNVPNSRPSRARIEDRDARQALRLDNFAEGW